MQYLRISATKGCMSLLRVRTEKLWHAQGFGDVLDADRPVDGFVQVVDSPLVVAQPQRLEGSRVQRPLRARQDVEVFEEHLGQDRDKGVVRLPVGVGGERRTPVDAIRRRGWAR